MSHCTQRNQTFLQQVLKSNPIKRKKLIKTSSIDNINALSEIALNTLKGNLKLTPLEIKKLKRHRKHIRKIAKRSISAKQKRNILIQKGGFLPLLLTPFLAAVGSIAGSAIAHSLGV